MWPQKFVYAVQALVILASHGGRRVSSARIAEESRVSHKFLESILNSLKINGLVTSSKGPNGGYALTHDPSTVHLLAVMEVFEPEWPLRTTELLDTIANDVRAQLAHVTVAEALMRAQQQRNAIDYVI